MPCIAPVEISRNQAPGEAGLGGSINPADINPVTVRISDAIRNLITAFRDVHFFLSFIFIFAISLILHLPNQRPIDAILNEQTNSHCLYGQEAG